MIVSCAVTKPLSVPPWQREPSAEHNKFALSWLFIPLSCCTLCSLRALPNNCKNERSSNCRVKGYETREKALAAFLDIVDEVWKEWRGFVAPRRRDFKDERFVWERMRYYIKQYEKGVKTGTRCGSDRMQ
ncbi:MAG: hypothetical protein R3F36_09215 [Candidatus Competibacteraceae bacterium]